MKAVVKVLAASGRLAAVLTCLAALAAVILLGGAPFGGPGGVGIGRPAGKAAAAPESGKYHQAASGDSFFKDSFCAGCHPSPPHSRSSEYRGLLNHHAVRLHCLVCHGQGLMDAAGGFAWKDKMLWPEAGPAALTPDREKALREIATVRGRCFPPGPACQDCHRPDGPLNFRRLGYDEAQVGRLVHLQEFFVRALVQKWFFPSIF